MSIIYFQPNMVHTEAAGGVTFLNHVLASNAQTKIWSYFKEGLFGFHLQKKKQNQCFS